MLALRAEAANAIRSGQITAEALAEALLSRIESRRELNAFIAVDPDAVRAAAREADLARRNGAVLGPLHGVPLVFKDNIDTVGLASTAGTPALRDNMPRRDAPVARALFDAGALLLGKGNMHELSFGGTSNNATYGPVRNPYDPSRIAGGSSGGPAAAVAARLATAGLGTDTGGSVRMPSSLCGLAGLRPTLHRYSQDGVVPIAASRDTIGPIARSVADLALLDAVVTGEEALPEISLSGLRLGLPRAHFWEDLAPETARLCEQALERLREAGVVLVEADLADIAALTEAVGFVLALYEPRAEIARYLAAAGSALSYEEIVAQVKSPDVSTILRSTLDPATAVSEEAYQAAIREHRPKLIATFADYFAANRVEATVFPTMVLPAPPVGEDLTIEINGRQEPTFGTLIRNVDPSSNAGLPGVTLPVGLTAQGLPVGLGLDGPSGSDRRLLAIAREVEKLFDPLPAPPEA